MGMWIDIKFPNRVKPITFDEMSGWAPSTLRSGRGEKIQSFIAYSLTPDEKAFLYFGKKSSVERPFYEVRVYIYGMQEDKHTRSSLVSSAVRYTSVLITECPLSEPHGTLSFTFSDAYDMHPNRGGFASIRGGLPPLRG